MFVLKDALKEIEIGAYLKKLNFINWEEKKLYKEKFPNIVGLIL